MWLPPTSKENTTLGRRSRCAWMTEPKFDNVERDEFLAQQFAGLDSLRYTFTQSAEMWP